MPLRNRDAIDCLVNVAQAQDSLFWDMLSVFSDNYNQLPFFKNCENHIAGLS
jgi:hypothetical protein